MSSVLFYIKILKNYKQKNINKKNKSNLNCIVISMGFKHSTCDKSTYNFLVVYMILYFINIIYYMKSCWFLVFFFKYAMYLIYAKAYSILKTQMIFQCSECVFKIKCENVKSSYILISFINFILSKLLMVGRFQNISALYLNSSFVIMDSLVFTNIMISLSIVILHL